MLGITRWYAEQGGTRLAERAFDAARQALARVEVMPGLRSPLAAERCGLLGLRHWGVEKFPVRWYYFEQGTHLDVVRLLADRQDIAAIPADGPPPA